MIDDKIPCAGCGESLSIENDDVVFSSNLDGDLYCNGCYESDLENSSELILIHGETSKVMFGDYFAMDSFGDVPDWFEELFNAWDGRSYKKTDGWRGHYSSFDKFKDVKRIASGWTTGWADATTQRKAKFNVWASLLIEGSIETPLPIYLLTEPTSNVFSTGVDVFCKTRDYKKTINWLDEIGTPQSLLQEQLS